MSARAAGREKEGLVFDGDRVSVLKMNRVLHLHGRMVVKAAHTECA